MSDALSNATRGLVDAVVAWRAECDGPPRPHETMAQWHTRMQERYAAVAPALDACRAALSAPPSVIADGTFPSRQRACGRCQQAIGDGEPSWFDEMLDEYTCKPCLDAEDKEPRIERLRALLYARSDGELYLLRRLESRASDAMSDGWHPGRRLDLLKAALLGLQQFRSGGPSALDPNVLVSSDHPPDSGRKE